MPAKLRPALIKHALRGLTDERSRAKIDEKILLLDAKT